MNSKPTSRKTLTRRLIAGAMLFALANVITFSSSQYFAKASDYKANVENFSDRPEARVLFLGDSHVARIHNEFLSGVAYNAAYGGDSLRECYAKLLYISDRHPHLHTVVLTIDPNMFGTARLESSNRAFADRYFLLSGSPVGLEQGRLSALRQQIPLFNDDFVQFLRKSIIDRLGNPRGSQSEADGAEPATWQQLAETARAEDAKLTGDMDHRGVGEHDRPFEWLERISTLARERGFQIVAVRYPAHPGYLATLPDRQRADLDTRLQRAGFDRILDFRHVLDDPAYFIDPDHMSPEGARKFLTLISEDLGVNLLASAPQDPKPDHEVVLAR